MRVDDLDDRSAYDTCFTLAERAIRDEASDVVRDYNGRVFDHFEGLAGRLMLHAINEAVGAAVLSRVARFHSGTEHHRRLASHARDEARHAKLLAEASARILPGLSRRKSHVLERASREIDGYDGQLMHFYCATHVAEIRNLFVLGQYVGLVRERPVLQGLGLDDLFTAILEDEKRHVDYTRVIIEPWLSSSDRARETFLEYVDMHKDLVLNPQKEAQE